MPIVIASILACLVIALMVVVVRKRRAKRELEENSITAEALHGLLEEQKRVLIFDIRQPLDLLAYSEIIPGSVRIPPKELLENPALIPRDEDAVVYCTCEGESTSREVVHRARMLNFMRLKLLRGGLAAWKAMGYPVERYEKPFHLDTV